MENDSLKEILKMDFPDIEIDSEKIISACIKRAERKRKFMKVASLSIVSLLLTIIAIIGIVVLENEKISTNVTRINRSITDLERIESDEERMMRIVELDREISAISKRSKENINVSELTYISSSTSAALKDSVKWGNSVNRSIAYYLIDTLIDINDISEVNIHKEKFGSEMWICKQKTFYSSLLGTLELPYIDLFENFSEELAHEFSDYTNYYSFILYLSNDDIVDIGVFNSGYVIIEIYGIKQDGHYGIKGRYVSLVRADCESLHGFMTNANFDKYDCQLSPVSLLIYRYSNGISAAIGPTMKFNLDQAKFECSIDCGSFSFYDKIQSLSVHSDETIQWATVYTDERDTENASFVDETGSAGEKVFMDVIIKVDDKVVGYIVIEMKFFDDYVCTTKVLEFNIYKDNKNRYKTKSLEYVFNRIKKAKEQYKE